MRKWYLLLLVLLPMLIWAQEVQQNIPGDPTTYEDYEDSEGMDYGMSGVVGTVNVNGMTYSQIRLCPELNLGKFGLGLDIDLLIDSEGKLRKEDWNDWQDYLNKIFFIRWANRRDPFYFKVGGIPSYTLGHGLIFDQYSNILRYPEVKNVGGYLGINTPISGAGFEVFTHNIHKNEVLAARLHANPLYYTHFPVLEDLKVGVNIGMDRNQYGKYPDSDDDGVPDVYDKFPNDHKSWLDTDGDGIPDNMDTDINGTGLIDHPDVNDWVAMHYPNITDGASEADFNMVVVQDSAMVYHSWKNIIVYSVDYILPLMDNKFFSLDHYGEYAMIEKYGKGIIFPGFSSKFLIFDAKLELRNFSDEFLPGYFDRLYEEKRATVSITEAGGRSIYSLSTKEDLLKTARSATGWFGYLRANILNLGNVKVAYQDMYGKNMNTGKSLWASATVHPAIIPSLKEASILYSQVHTEYIDFKNLRCSDATVSGKLVYNISGNTDLVGRYSELYFDANSDGEIRGKNEVIRTFAFGVDFSF
ncbi:MAG: hypothetical protein LHW41_07800 [Candidatus Cloacimonetes bacterium]|nr:hypothetical protein [Candidatus Cloacimonadota bacterium]